MDAGRNKGTTMATTINNQTAIKVVARCVASKTWRSEAEKEACAYAKDRAERTEIAKYVREQYDAAGAGFSGRW